MSRIPVLIRRRGVQYVAPYKLVVKNRSINPVICAMGKQRRNDVFIRQVVDKLRQTRRARNLTQENVRFDTDLNIGRIESGQCSISLSTLADLCDYYEIAPGDLFRDVVTHL